MAGLTIKNEYVRMGAMKVGQIRKISLYGMLLALAMVLSYIEAILPLSIGIPGVKLGLPNLVSILGIFSIGTRGTVLISLLRIFLTAATFGNAQTLLYSLLGWGLSMSGMLLMKRLHFGMLSISVTGGMLHNLGQLLAAVFLLKSPVLFTYLPVLLFSGVVSGAIIGMLGGVMTARVGQYLSGKH